MNILTIDIGGTTSKFALVNDQGKILKKFPAVDSRKGHDLEWLFNHIQTFDVDNYEKISICLPGFYNPSKKEIALSGNLEYKNFKVFDECQKYTSKEIVILNDANAAALGEYWKLALENHNIKNVLVYTIGTGVGGGIILNGKLYEGTQGYAGEFGHGGNFQNDAKCTCGLENCLEVKSSANGILKAINEFAETNKDSILHLKLKEKGKDLKFENLINLVDNKNEDLLNVFEKAIDPLLRHMSIMIYAFNPQVIIIGGGLSHLGKPISEKMIEKLSIYVAPFLFEKLELRNAKYGNDAAFYGCAYKALESQTKLI